MNRHKIGLFPYEAHCFNHYITFVSYCISAALSISMQKHIEETDRQTGSRYEEMESLGGNERESGAVPTNDALDTRLEESRPEETPLGRPSIGGMWWRGVNTS